ncbi:nonstructural protein [Blackfly microvirus SF02]|uniref:Nonstructural protein n=1 Tax=Blackfly microvirus SF02 TaxID=2576452 RepID=A0A4P8PKJ6_9VIRU|nr:nonstructural protein [Blackfly microvirus SF02]
MKLQIFTVFDSAVGAHLQPFFSRSVGEAIRSFQDAVNDPKSQFASHASDYTLFLHGTFDDAGGVFSTSPAERVTSALELVFKYSDPDTPAPWHADSALKTVTKR